MSDLWGNPNRLVVRYKFCIAVWQNLAKVEVDAMVSLHKSNVPQVQQRKKWKKGIISQLSHKSDKGIGLGLNSLDLWDVGLWDVEPVGWNQCYASLLAS